MSEVQLTKVCTKCKVEKPVNCFGPNQKAAKDGLHSHCRECRATYSREHKQIRVVRQKQYVNDPAYYSRMYLYDMRPSDYEELLERQQGVCAICGQEATGKNQWGSISRLAVDHCHETGQIRGLLCMRCNAGLGHFKDNPNLLAKAIAYLTQ